MPVLSEVFAQATLGPDGSWLCFLDCSFFQGRTAVAPSKRHQFRDRTMMTEELVMVGYYDYRLVALSVVISILAAYAARNLSERLNATRGRVWLAWLAVGATVDGIGTWSMHYTGMLAFHLPVPVLYDWPTVLLSFLAGIFGSAAALLVLSGSKKGWTRTLAASILLGGVGIPMLHYTGMTAMRLRGMHHYSPLLVTLSVVLAIGICACSLTLTFLVRDDAHGRSLRNHGSALLRGAANPVMHFTAMAATSFTYAEELPDLSHAVDISSLGDLGISIVPLMVPIVALLTSLVDRLQKQTALLDELFEQAPQAKALLSADDRVVRVNRDFTRVFGYTPQEAIGHRLSELIVPDELRDEDQRYADLAAHGQCVDVEVVRQRKDGSHLQVAMVRVPVSVPGGQVEIYAIYRDITERKRAEEALRQYAECLQVLSSRVVEVQEEERRHLARELHDEIGQALTAIGINLEVIGRACSPADRPRIEDCLGIIHQAIDQVHGLALDLRPSILDDLGLAATLRWLVDRQAQRAGFVGHFIDQSSATPLHPDLATACFRAVQEALTNVVRHARARQVWVELRQGDAEVQLIIRDDGVGFDPGRARQRSARGASLGLLGIQERIELLGGQLAIESEPGHGTTVRVWLPATCTPPSEDSGEEGGGDEARSGPGRMNRVS
jgi:PAS domain S-box-containing protein